MNSLSFPDEVAESRRKLGELKHNFRVTCDLQNVLSQGGSVGLIGRKSQLLDSESVTVSTVQWLW